MKINPNGPAYPMEEKYLEAGIQCREQHYGIPIRLEIAARAPIDEVARLVPQTAGECADELGMTFAKFDGLRLGERRDAIQLLYSKARLRWADALIAAYNNDALIAADNASEPA